MKTKTVGEGSVRSGYTVPRSVKLTHHLFVESAGVVVQVPQYVIDDLRGRGCKLTEGVFGKPSTDANRFWSVERAEA